MLADSVAELCFTLIRIELADPATGGFSLSGSFLLNGCWVSCDLRSGCGQISGQISVDFGFTPCDKVWWRLPHSLQMDLLRHPEDMWPDLKQLKQRALLRINSMRSSTELLRNLLHLTRACWPLQRGRPDLFDLQMVLSMRQGHWGVECLMSQVNWRSNHYRPSTLGNFDLKLGQTLSAVQGLGPCTQTNQNGVPKWAWPRRTF